MDFTGKVVLITGASSGIGAGTAELFSKLNANISITGRNEINLKKTIEQCKAVNSNVTILPVIADINKDCEKIVEETLKKFGKIDVLVNNAGILANGSILEADINQLDKILQTNLYAVFQLTKLVIPHLIKTNGNIVNVSSLAGLRSFPNALTYCISKSALDQFTKCTALDLAPKNIRVNSVNPGVIITDIHKRTGMDETTYSAYLEHSKLTHAMGRVGNVPEVANAITFLASDQASFITGALLPVDGGRHCMCPR